MNVKTYIIDRFEGDFAVCEAPESPSRETEYISIDKLYKNAKEGDIIKLENGEYHLDETATKKARNKNIALQNSLFDSE